MKCLTIKMFARNFLRLPVERITALRIVTTVKPAITSLSTLCVINYEHLVEEYSEPSETSKM